MKLIYLTFEQMPEVPTIQLLPCYVQRWTRRTHVIGKREQRKEKGRKSLHVFRWTFQQQSKLSCPAGNNTKIAFFLADNKNKDDAEVALAFSNS